MDKLIQNKLDDIIAVSKQHYVQAISLFGSAAKNNLRKDSDSDLLVEFSSDINVLDYADNYFSLLNQLESILNRKVDLVSNKSLKNPVLKEEIYQSKIDLYAA
ncbi:nucleotidyltransferase family protein [Flavobacterium sp. CS20]|uniref:nucleotidyltransferase family protein n=1 Tax=Flavobacterium sp. CS20 TaxID=2775246 RepID=UPI001B3A2039|nr:nucleotidyltransferase domain-containing protein [Flavobacterium sp. CS20]QTY27404.1 nucleotidyltransferase domain-containing protein [Flavobacterium sp. CS20]